MIQYLLHLGADPSEDMALISAVSAGTEILQQLLNVASARKPLCSKVYFNFALQEAIRSSDISAATLLILAGAEPNKICRQSLRYQPYENFRCGISCFGIAVESDETPHSEMTKLLLDAGADPNAVVKYKPKMTALMMAISSQNLSVVKLLLDRGAAVNGGVNFGFTRTPLQLAAEVGNIDIIQDLLNCSADVNAAPHDRCGATALQFAAIGGHVGIAKLLLNHWAGVNAPPAKIGGRTALEASAEHGRLDMLQFLIDSGAGLIDQGQEQYERAVELAKENGHMAASRLLERSHVLCSTHVWQNNFACQDSSSSIGWTS
ncbi:ankyrin [Mytilinidion resinicola]|uniref:Ankyrin n=1 Tax=Mytilinidion resinicola TaxID=574789 RepID=A0A6A6Y0V9_9PEZI|nr:ankyrin [Mytilinidion resinicola]KAF2802280.1 ankyrin [Mytilinidion resinicola]